MMMVIVTSTNVFVMHDGTHCFIDTGHFLPGLEILCDDS